MRKLNVIKRNSNSFDVSNELLLQRYHNGIRIIRPKLAHNPHSISILESLKLPFNLFILDLNGAIRKQNEPHAAAHGFDSPLQYIGKNALDIIKIKEAIKLRNNDLQVMHNKKSFVFEEDIYVLKNKAPFKTLSVKIPCYNEYNQIMGLLGLSITLGQQDVVEFFSKLLNIFVFNQAANLSNYSSRIKIDNVYLSQRQLEILRLVVRGKSSKDIGTLLHLSYRTVQHYLDTIKLKLNVSSRSELIEKVIDDLI